MDDKPKFTKLKELDGDVFTIEAVLGYSFKRWDEQEHKMETSDTPQKGFSKRWSLDTSKGRLEVSQNQFGKILEALFNKEKNDLTGKILSVKGNGQEGFQADYYFNIVRARDPQDEPREDLGF